MGHGRHPDECKSRRRISLIWVARASVLLAVFWGGSQADADRFEEARKRYQEIVKIVDPVSLRETVRFMSRSPRIGTPGKDVMKFLASRSALGAFGPVQSESFDVTIPDPESVGVVSCEGKTVTVWPLWPNGIQTSACDLTADLVDVGGGSLAEFSGKQVQGRVLLMDFASGSNWRNGLRLGAAAILFRGTIESYRGEGELKWSELPIDFPRFWVPPESVPSIERLVGKRIRLACSQTWIDVPADNLFVKVKGTDPEMSGEWVMISAYCDSMSVVPGILHGADQSAGIAAFLEFLKVLRKYPPKRSVLLLVTNSHFLGLRGMREFVERRFRDDWAITGGKSPHFSFTFDLSSGTSAICPLAQGWWADYRNENKGRERTVARVLGEQIGLISSVLRMTPSNTFFDGVNSPDGRHWKNSIPGRYAAEAEILNLAGQNAITFSTLEDSRSRQDSPFDTENRVNYGNLVAQARTTACLLFRMVNDTQNEAVKDAFVAPFRRGGVMRRLGFTAGFGTVSGQVLRYDPSKSFLPDEPIPGALVTSSNSYSTYMGVRGLQVVRSNEAEGRFRLIGVPTTTSREVRFRTPMTLQAYLLNSQSQVEMAIDTSQGYKLGYNPHFMMNTGYYESPLILFPCKTVTITGITDPMLLKPIDFFFLMNAKNHGYTQSGGWLKLFGDLRYRSSLDDVIVLFVNPDEPFKLTGNFEAGDVRFVLTNSNETDLIGSGYTGSQLSQMSRFDAALPVARDAWNVNEWRLRRLRAHRISNPGIEELHLLAKQTFARAESAYAAADYVEAQRLANAAWGLSLRCHPMILGTTKDILNGLLFYLVLLIPFSYLAERLFVASKTLTKQVLWSGGVFGASFLALKFLHPAFDLTDGSFIIFIAFILAALSVIVGVFVVGKFESSLKSLQRATSDAQAGIRTGKLNLFGTALAIGVSNMRRRKARTLMTAATLLIVTFTALSFTSVDSDLRFNALPSDGEPRYNGILLRTYALDPIDENAYRLFATEFGPSAHIGRRAWYFGGETNTFSVATLRFQSRTVEIGAVLGMDASEAHISRPQEALIAGSNWFADGDDDSIILPSSVADRLGVTASHIGTARVVLGGISLRVIGIASDTKLKEIDDLDNEPIMPADFRASDRLKKVGRAGEMAFRKYVRLDPSRIVIVPAKIALFLGADIRNLAASFESSPATEKALDELMPRTGLNLYASIEGASGLEIRRFSTIASTTSRGFEYILLPLLMAMVFVLNTMVASVIERRSEISTLSSVGLAPRQIAALFLAESLVYAVLGSVLGYFAAQIVSLTLSGTDLMTGLNVNYSSLGALIATGLVAGVVMLSTIYPARMAVRVATPSGQLNWDAAPPTGDDLVIRLPFTVSKNHAEQLAHFYNRWLQGHSEYAVGEFVTEGAKLSEHEGSYSASATCWLKPYDLGVQQNVQLTFDTTDVEGIYQIVLGIRRLAGDPEHWENVNRRFLAAFRQQFLIWRTLQGGQTPA